MSGKIEKKFKAGGVSAAVWKNTGTSRDGKPIVFQSVSLERGYKDKNGEWKNTASLRPQDIPDAVLALNKSYEFIRLKDMDSFQSADRLAEEGV